MSYKNSFDDRVISNEEFKKIPADQHYQWSPVPSAEVTDGDFTSVPDGEPSVPVVEEEGDINLGEKVADPNVMTGTDVTPPEDSKSE